MVPVAAVADTVATSPALLKIMARVLDVPLKVLVPVMVCTVSVVTGLSRLPLTNRPELLTHKRLVPPGAKMAVLVKVVVPKKLPSMMLLSPVVTQQPALQPRNMLFEAVVLAQPARRPIKVL